jgi:LysM repeat protein
MHAWSERIAAPAAAAALIAVAFFIPSYPAPAAHPAADRIPALQTQAGPAAQPLSTGLAQEIDRMRLAARPAAYTVRPGDTLSSIAGRVYSQPAAWTVLYWSNRGTVRWADEIEAGQVLTVPAEPAEIPAAPAQLGPPAPAPARELAAYTAAPAQSPGYTQAAAVTYRGVPGSFQECVIARESGGDASAVNPASGAGGLYGFLPSTWASLGYSGLPEDASVAVQTQAFDKLYAEAGTTPWSSDGCA